MRTWLPFTPNTVTVTSSPTIRVSPTRRVRISIPFSLKRIQFSKQSAKIKGGHVPQDMEPQAFHQLLTSNDKLKVPGAAFQTTEGWSLPPKSVLLRRSGRGIQVKGGMQGTHRQLQILLFYDNRNLDF